MNTRIEIDTQKSQMMRDVYITSAGVYLPGEPVTNDRMEDYIGKVAGRDSVIGRRALRSNGIESRHYAIDDRGRVRDSNAGLSAKAIRHALSGAKLELSDMTFLATATTQGDLLVPGHAAMVHGELESPPIEIASFQSVCGASLMAAKSAWLQVRTREHDVAVACASEMSSRWFRPSFYEGSTLFDSKNRLNPQADFLRFTLSDGAGAIVLEAQPRKEAINLKIEFIDIISLAGSFESCMWAGSTAENRTDLTLGWSHSGPKQAQANGEIALLQDFNLLKQIMRAWVGEYLKSVDIGRIVPSEVDWMLCHYSAESLKTELVSLLENTAGMVPLEKWFSNLKTVGNIGTASIWVMLEAFLRSGKLCRGEKVLCVVPESGRALVGFMMLEAV